MRLVGKRITAREPMRPKLKTMAMRPNFCYTRGVQEIPSLIAVIDDDESMRQDSSAINPPAAHTVGNQTISAADSAPSIMVPIRRD